MSIMVEATAVRRLRVLLLSVIAAIAATIPLLSGDAGAQAEESVVFDPPADIVAELSPDHPRLLVDDDRFAEIVTSIGGAGTGDPCGLAEDGPIGIGERLCREAIARAEILVGQPVSVYVENDGEMLDVTRDVQHRVVILGMAYRLSDDPRYRTRLWDELVAAAAFPDWNEGSFLSVAELLHAFALAYDWLHDELSADQRALLRTAIVEKGLLKARAQYDAATFWTRGSSNWNVVCNGAVIMAGLAIGDEEPALANDLMHRAFDSLANGVGEYGPDGGYAEGVGYWEYATRFLVATAASLETAVGDDYGITDAPGVDRTMDYQLHLTGPTGLQFNFADAGVGAGRGGPAAGYWLARWFDDPAYAWWSDLGAETTDASFSPLSLMGLGQIEPVDPGTSGLAMDRDFQSGGIVTMRSSWDRNATYVGFRAGDNLASHGDLDMGTFVLDALGVRWANELGYDDYALPGYFGDGRWDYYRKRAEGQNTLVLEPGAAVDQALAGSGTVIAREHSPQASFAVADLTSAYAPIGVTRWHRGVAQIDGRSRVLIQDEVSSTTPVTPWWFMHTAADIDVAEDGASAILSLGGRTLSARLLDPPAGARFSSMAAEPLPTAPHPEGQATNAFRKLVVTADASTEMRLVVLLEPLATGEPSAPPAVEALAQWSAAPVLSERLTGITIDGQPLAGFGAESLRYVADRSPFAPVPVVAATSADGVPVEVTQATGLPGRAEICVGTGCAVQYEVSFQDLFGDPVAASIVGTNPAMNVLDGDLATLWTANGDGQWIQADLPDPVTVSGVALAWSLGSQRIYDFTVQTSLDAVVWNDALVNGESSGGTSELEEHAFAPRTARYVRVIGHGNSDNEWNSLAELRVVTAEGPWPAAPVVPEPRLVALGSVPDDVVLAPEDGASLTYRATYSDGSTRAVPAGELLLSSTDPGVVSVDADARITATAPGEAVVVAELREDGRLAFARTPVSVPDDSFLALPAVRDGYVFDGSPDTVYGAASQMVVKTSRTAGATRFGYLVFDLSGVDPDRIVRATIKLRAGVSVDRSMVIAVHGADPGWTEAGLTWNTRPAIASDPLGTVVAPPVRTDLRLDLTAAVRAAAGGEFGLALQQAAGDTQVATASVATRETGATGPLLELEFTSSDE